MSKNLRPEQWNPNPLRFKKTDRVAYCRNKDVNSDERAMLTRMEMKVSSWLKSKGGKG